MTREGDGIVGDHTQSRASQYDLPLVCEYCGGPVRAVRSDERVLIRCEACNKRLFSYYLDPARQKPGEEPPEWEDLFFVKRVERDLLNELGQPAQALYDFLRRYILHHGYAPTLREMQAGLGWDSPTSVRHHLNQLVEAGLIERECGTARGIRLVHVA